MVESVDHLNVRRRPEREPKLPDLVLETIETLAKDNLGIIINTHYPEHALRCAHKTLLLGRNGYLFDETRKVITEENIKKFFGVESSIVTTRKDNTDYYGIVPISLSKHDITSIPVKNDYPDSTQAV